MAITFLDGPSIAAGESLSDGLDCSGGTIMRITMPFYWTAANITFQISTDGDQYNDLVGVDGQEINLGLRGLDLRSSSRRSTNICAPSRSSKSVRVRASFQWCRKTCASSPSRSTPETRRQRKAHHARRRPARAKAVHVPAICAPALVRPNSSVRVNRTRAIHVPANNADREMAFLFKCDTESVVKRLTKMRAHIQHVKEVEIGNMLSDWQTQDMHRKHPATKRIRSRGIARTTIRPHSLYEMKRSRKFGQRLVRRAKSAAKRHLKFEVPTVFMHTSQRPILRHSLLLMLQSRFKTLAQSIKW